ncbi:MAG TPA: phosphatidylcholine/phosphatidylserine synthase [Pyrinomonadaceae bacterium]|nr:phosphatidylcholine/phosphatidylserine synthase [Pyrinomonadaceae bacterium]
MAVETPRVEPDEPTKVERKGLKKGLYLLPSAFTAANVAMGYYAVMSALKGFQLLGGAEGDAAAAAVHINNAALAIGWAILFDTLDGRIARMTKTTTEIGVQLDSISDVLTFGIAPAVLTYVWAYGSTFQEGSPEHKFGWFVSFFFLMCGGFRLARFNVQAMRPRPLMEGTAKLDKKNFVGLPIPAAAGMLAALIHFAPAPLRSYGGRTAEIYSGLMMALMATLALLMVSTVRYSSFKAIGGSRRTTRVVILLVISVAMLVWLFSRQVLLVLMASYVLYGPLSRLFSLVRPRR